MLWTKCYRQRVYKAPLCITLWVKMWVVAYLEFINIFQRISLKVTSDSRKKIPSIVVIHYCTWYPFSRIRRYFNFILCSFLVQTLQYLEKSAQKMLKKNHPQELLKLLVTGSIVLRNKLVLRNHFPWPNANLLHKYKELLALRNNLGQSKSSLSPSLTVHIWEKSISILAGNLNLDRSYLITTVSNLLVLYSHKIEQL